MGVRGDLRERIAERGRGPKGPPGADGKGFLFGAGAPGTSVGTVGEFYFDYLHLRIYGPKEEGGWTNLVGQLIHDATLDGLIADLIEINGDLQLINTGLQEVNVAAQTALNTALSEAQAAVEAAIEDFLEQKGQPNGLASLDENGLVPYAQMKVGTTAGTVAAGDDSRFFDSSADYGTWGPTPPTTDYGTWG